MYRVVLVDDEPYVREGLREFINWEKYEFKVCAEASGGEEAAEKIRNLLPDLVITDVEMPVKNGLDLIAYMQKEEDSGTKYIILSGYDKFEYIKQAISLNVVSYLLKPLEFDKIEETLEKVKRQEERYKQMLLLAKTDVDFFVDDKEQSRNAYRAVFVEIYEKNTDRIDLEERKAEVLRTFCKIVGEHGITYLQTDREGRIFVILKQNENRDFYADLEKAIWLLDEQKHWRVRMFAGEICHGKKEAEEQIRFLADCSECAFYQTDPTVIKPENMKRYTFNYENILLEMMGEIENPVQLQQWKRRMQKHQTAPEIIRGTVLRWIEKNKKKCGCQELCIQLGQMNFAEICKTMHEIMEKNEQRSDGTPENKNGKVDEVLSYVREHCRENLKLNELAKSFFFNSSYLGRILAAKTGMNFNSYLHFLRIQEAKKMLAQNEKQISEIASELGYADSEYFAEKFKEFEQVPPSVYRKGLLENAKDH